MENTNKLMQLKTKTKEFKKSDLVSRGIFHQNMKMRGYVLIGEEELTKFSGGKGFLLALLFLPLAFFGRTKYVRLTYEKRT